MCGVVEAVRDVDVLAKMIGMVLSVVVGYSLGGKVVLEYLKLVIMVLK